MKKFEKLQDYVANNKEELALTAVLAIISAIIFFIVQGNLHIVFLVKLATFLMKKAYFKKEISNKYLQNATMLSFAFCFIYAFGLCSDAAIFLKIMYIIDSSFILSR